MSTARTGADTGLILLGIWLAFSYGGYDIWDPWIIAALVLWVLAAATGQRTGAEYMAGMTKARELEAAGQSGPSTELLAINPATGLRERGYNVVEAADEMGIAMVLTGERQFRH